MLLKLENLFGHFNQIVFLKYCVSCVNNSLKNTKNPQNLQVFVILWLLTKSKAFNFYICFLSCIVITEDLKDTNLKKMEKILFQRCFSFPGIIIYQKKKIINRKNSQYILYEQFLRLKLLYSPTICLKNSLQWPFFQSYVSGTMANAPYSNRILLSCICITILYQIIKYEDNSF